MLNADDAMPIGHYAFKAETVLAFLTGCCQDGQKEKIREMKSFLAPSDLYDRLSYGENLSDEQIDALLRFELLRQEKARGASPPVMRLLKENVDRLELPNQLLKEQGKPVPSRTYEPYVKDGIATIVKRTPDIPVLPLDEKAYSDRGIPYSDILYLLKRTSAEKVIEEFNRPPEMRRTSMSLMNQIRLEENAALMKPEALVAGVDDADIRLMQDDLHHSRLLPAAKQLLGFGRAAGLAILPEKMALTEDKKGLLISASSFTMEEMNKELIRLANGHAGSGLRTSVKELKSEPQKRLTPAVMRIEGPALTEPSFLEKIAKASAERSRRERNL